MSTTFQLSGEKKNNLYANVYRITINDGDSPFFSLHIQFREEGASAV